MRPEGFATLVTGISGFRRTIHQTANARCGKPPPALWVTTTCAAEVAFAAKPSSDHKDWHTQLS
jgi:hypothetical protein